MHPSQRSLVERDYSGPTRVSGSAGTGKTIVGLHRAVFLARRHPQKILLTTFSPALANALAIKLNRLVGNESNVASRIEIKAVHEAANDLYTATYGSARIVDPEELRSHSVATAEQVAPRKFTASFLFNEWSDVVDPWQLTTWEDYRDVPRLGRKTRLGINPFRITTETSIDIELEDEGTLIRGRIDVLVLNELLWLVVIESKRSDFAVTRALPQTLAYMLGNLNQTQPTFGFITNGIEFLFLKAQRQPAAQYATSKLFSLINPGNELYNVLPILKHLARAQSI